MKSKKRGCLIAIISFVAALIIAILIVFRIITAGLERFKDMDYSSLNLNQVSDGTYTGSADGTIVKATVEITVKNHIITGIRLLNHDNGKGKPAEVIVNKIVQQNSLEVDAVSGATYSSYVIKAAVLDALTD